MYWPRCPISLNPEILYIRRVETGAATDAAGAIAIAAAACVLLISH